MDVFSSPLPLGQDGHSNSRSLSRAATYLHTGLSPDLVFHVDHMPCRRERACGARLRTDAHRVRGHHRRLSHVLDLHGGSWRWRMLGKLSSGLWARLLEPHAHESVGRHGRSRSFSVTILSSPILLFRHTTLPPPMAAPASASMYYAALPARGSRCHSRRYPADSTG